MKCVLILLNLHLWNFYKCIFLCGNHKYITNVYLNQEIKEKCFQSLPFLIKLSEYCRLKLYGPKIWESSSNIQFENVTNFVFGQFSIFPHKFKSNYLFWNALVDRGADSKEIKNVTLFFLNNSKNNLTQLLKRTVTFSSSYIYLQSECTTKISKRLKFLVLHKIDKRSVQKDYESSNELFNIRNDNVNNVVDSTTAINPKSCLEIERPSDQSQDSLKNSIQKVIVENGHLTLNCPEVTLESKVEWYKNKAKLNSSFRNNMAETETEPHLTIDSYNALYILQATKEEEGNYTCYIDSKPFQTYCVKVVSKSKLLNEDFFRYSLYLGFVLSLTITCYCAGIGVAWHQRGYFADPLYLSLNNK